MPSPSKNLLFKKGTFLAVLGDADDFWLCWNNQHVYLETGFFDIGWFEKVTKIEKEDVYVKHAAVNSVNLGSVIGKVNLIRESSGSEFLKRKSNGSDTLYRLPQSEKMKIEKILKLKKEGYVLNAYEKDFKEERTCDVLILEPPEGLEEGGGENCCDTNLETEKSRKRKSSAKICLCCLDETITDKKNVKSKKGCTTCATKKSKKEKVTTQSKGKKTRQGSGKVKKVKKEKKPIDKTNPNWRVKPNEAVTVWTKDPLFETKDPVPFVSSTAHSRLVTRAVITNDIDLLNKCIKNGKEIMSINYRRSMACDLTPMDYAVKFQNLKAIEALLKEETLVHTKKVERCGQPLCLLPTIGTGVYNYRSLGVRNIRRLNVSRGAREGNNAFTKDQSSEMNPGSMMEKVEEQIMCWNLPIKFINSLTKLKEYKKLKNLNDREIEDQFINEIANAVRYGNNELAAHFIDLDIKKGCQQFSRFFKEALITAGDPWSESTVREVSARKKADWSNKSITPMHCACINPNSGPLESLFKVCPDLYIADNDGRKLVHYAAACKGIKPMEFLVTKGANLEDTDKNGRTPLMTACQVGRAQTAKFIIQKLSQNENDSASKFGVAGIDRPTKDSWCPLHIAVENGNRDVVQVLLDSGANADKPLNTKYDKMTPLMLASASGDLEMVKILVKKAKIMKPDRYKKTALTHAVINGASNVASYLLSLGSDPNKVDSSENSNLHYACAYGWWFCMKVLIEAGAKVDAFNEWKLTPLGVSLLKGNKGIANHLITMPNIDINLKDEKGRTILMNMIVDQKDTFTEEYLADLKEFVEIRGADPKLVDNDGKNILHYLAAYNYGSDKKSKSLKKVEMLDKAFEFFLQKGVSIFQADDSASSGSLPLVEALKNKSIPKYEDEDNVEYDHKQTNTKLIFRIIDQMTDELNIGYPKNFQIEAEDHCYEIISTFASTVSLFYAKEDYEVFQAIVKYFNSLIQEKKLNGMEFANVENSQYKTPFARLCMTYKSSKIQYTRNYSYFGGSNQTNKMTNDEQMEYWNKLSDIMEEFILTFKPKLQYHTSDKENTKIKHNFSSVLTLYEAHDYAIGLKKLLKHKPSLDEENEHGFTCLEKFIDDQDEEGVKIMLEAGANINHIQKEQVPEESNKVPILNCPIYMAVKKMNLKLIEVLIKNGANIDTLPLIGRSLIHAAVEICAQEKNRNNLAIVKLLLDSGSNVNEKDANNRTPLHISVNKGRDRSDESLDLEILLLKRGADLYSLDKRLRLPLHYAFVKIKAHTDRTPSDPIQIVSTLVDAMDKDKLDQIDVYGCSPLHYAAYHGATVCSLLLIQKGANIDAVDHHGHTSISYAVLGKHDGCALMLIQKDANINVKIKPAELFSSPEKNTSTTNLWKFFPEHWPKKERQEEYSLFQGIVTNDWLGITYVVIGKLEMFGMSFAKALEVALQINKFQFAKTLINKQVNESKLKEIVSKGRNLINCLAFESPASGADDTGSRRVELQADVINLLMEAHVCPDLPDDFGCLPLHYACLKHNLHLVQLLLNNENVVNNINVNDSFGRTAVAAALWNYDKSKNSSMKQIIKTLIEKGAKLNFLFKSKPLSVLRQGYNAKDSSADYHSFTVDSTMVSPLMIALIHQDKAMVMHLLKNGANVTLTDSMGVSPIMYAVKTNDIDLISNFIDEAVKKSPQTGTNSLAVNMDCVDCVDKRGQGLLHHTLAINDYYENSPTYDNPRMMELVLNSGINKSATQKGIKTPLEVAKLIGANEMGKVLAENIGVSFDPALLQPSGIVNIEAIEKLPKYDMVNDAATMVQQVEKELQDKMDTQVPTQRQAQHGCTVTTGHIHEDYEILMNKVDVSLGAWGLYNFYRMQIWKEEHKDLYILFTNWGRIETYGRGQYQNTPYSTAEAAIEEFCKIFKAKTGNDWNDKANFVNKPKKYRLVQVEHTQKVIRPKISFDLKTEKASILPKTVYRVVRDMTNVNMLTEAYKYEVNIDTGSIPFGRIKKDAIIEANKLLEKMEPLIITKEKLDTEKYEERTNEEKQQAILDKLGSTVNQICTLSSEYYYLLPTSGFEYEKVRPIDTVHRLNEEKKRTAYILEFEIAERMLLGAMFRKKIINPADYIYKGLGCQVNILDENCQESQLIMNYMYQSKGAKGLRIEGIYQLQREDELNQFNASKDANNRKLLWHGTKLVNMLSLLNKGLIINPPHAERTGRMFGDGLYFADVFDKSYGYTHDGRRGYARNMSEYILLCDVNLGNCKKLETYDTWRSEQISKEDMVGFDSLCVTGVNGPDEGSNVKINGFSIPLGSIKKTETDNSYRRLPYNEYIIYDDTRVVVRYLIKIGNGQYKDDEDTFNNVIDKDDNGDSEVEDDDDDKSCSSEGSTD